MNAVRSPGPVRRARSGAQTQTPAVWRAPATPRGTSSLLYRSASALDAPKLIRSCRLGAEGRGTALRSRYAVRGATVFALVGVLCCTAASPGLAFYRGLAHKCQVSRLTGSDAGSDGYAVGTEFESFVLRSAYVCNLPGDPPEVTLFGSGGRVVEHLKGQGEHRLPPVTLAPGHPVYFDLGYENPLIHEPPCKYRVWSLLVSFPGRPGALHISLKRRPLVVCRHWGRYTLGLTAKPPIFPY